MQANLLYSLFIIIILTFLYLSDTMVFTLRGVESGRIFVLILQLRSKNAILCADVWVI